MRSVSSAGLRCRSFARVTLVFASWSWEWLTRRLLCKDGAAELAHRTCHRVPQVLRARNTTMSTRAHPAAGTSDAIGTCTFGGVTLIPNIASLLWNTAAARAAQPAVLEGAAATDYATLQGRAAAIGMALTASGLRAYDRVGIFLDGGAEAIAAVFGVAAAGGIAVVINESLRPRQVEHTLEASGATALITSEDLLSRQPRRLETHSRILLAREFPNTAAVSFTPVP